MTKKHALMIIKHRLNITTKKTKLYIVNYTSHQRQTTSLDLFIKRIRLTRISIVKQLHTVYK